MNEAATADDRRQTSELHAAFLRQLAHQLRTPLGSMLMLAELLADNAGGRLSEREVGYAQKIQRAGAEIRGLIEDVLALSRIETGAVAVEPAEVPIAELMSDLEDAFAELAEDRPVELATAVEAAAPPAVRTDRRQLLRLLRLLLARAVRVTAQGTVTLRAAPARPGIEIAVKDAGTPIPEAQRAAIFEPFHLGGHGLGLAIARALAELLGGRLELATEERLGNTFVLHLPIGLL